MRKRLIIIGIDGMDLDVVRRYRESLPNITSLIENNPDTTLRSVFPADTTPAWSTIYLGEDPTQHGVVNFINIGARSNTYEPLTFTDDVYRGRTFWDVLNSEGYRCAVVLPMNVKEGWEIEGLMITRPSAGADGPRVLPEDRLEAYSPRAEVLGTEGKFTSESDLGRLKREYFDKAAEEWRLTKLAICEEAADLVFAYFSTTDGIQHDFWRHCDSSHPGYPGRNEHEDAIRDMYAFMDGVLGEIRRMQPGTPLLVVSDHGHGARPVRVVRINELLRRGGYVSPRLFSAGRGAKKKLRKAIRNCALFAVRRVGLPAPLLRMARKFPMWKGMFASSRDFDWEKTTAYLSDLSALKNYSYGGIRINDNVADKEALADEVIRYLEPVTKPDGGRLFEWIVRTDSFYSGKHLDRYPEIIFQMDESYGGEWELGENVFDDAGLMHALSPGGHRWRSAVLFADNITLEPRQYELTDVYHLILDTVRNGG